MEMTSNKFRDVLARVLSRNRPTIMTVRMGSDYREVEQIRDRSLQFEITTENRETIYQKLIDQINEWIRQSGIEDS